MRIPPASPRAARPRSRVPKRTRWRIIGAYTMAVGLVGCALWLLVPFRSIPTPAALLYEWALAHGHQAYGTARLRDVLPKVPGRVLASVDVPKLVIDVGFAEMEALYAKRAEALANQTLIQEADDFVPAAIRHGNRNTRVRIRLKGDFTDHLDTKKWSFRVHVRGEDHLFGLRRFSLQHPKVRGYQGEALFFDYLRRIGLLAPQYFFVHVTINGNEVGIMAVEEHFSKELLESQSRRNGVIIRFDESLFWEERVTRGIDTWLSSRVMHYTNSPVDAFRAGSVGESPELSRDLHTAVGLLRGFVEGTLPASAAFDVERLGRFLAACELWSARHALYWNNLRFFLDPVSLRLEPIAFDAAVANWPDGNTLVARQEPIVNRMLEDPAVFTAYEAGLRQLAGELLSEGLLDELERVQQSHLSILRKEYVLLEQYPLAGLADRARFLSSERQIESPPVATEVYPALVLAFLITESDGPHVELANLVPHPVEVVSARWISVDGSRTEPLEILAGPRLPLRLPPTPVKSVPRSQKMPYKAPSSDDLQLELRTRLSGEERDQMAYAQLYHSPATDHPISAWGSEEPLTAHSFVEVDSVAREVHISPGTWLVQGSVLVPRDFKLIAAPGTTLRFEEDAALIALGPIELRGTATDPIVLEGRKVAGEDGPWQGIVALQGNGKSTWSNVIVRNTTGIRRSWWDLTGGVTFQWGQVELRKCTFSGNRGEDALNIINGNFLLEDLSIIDTLSDGLDIDYGRGTIRGASFRNIGAVSGGDALDVSGAVVSIDDSSFANVRDKALSVGERSRVKAQNLRIVDTGVGAASKDDSLLKISTTTIRLARFVGLMAYVKKPVFGSSRIEARAIHFESVEVEARAQTGSQIEIDGDMLATEDMDIDELYGTIMRPGLRQ